MNDERLNELARMRAKDTAQWNEIIVNKMAKDFEIQKPTYETKKEVTKSLVGFAGSSMEGEDALRLISLVSKLTMLYRQKTPEATPIGILTAAFGSADSRGAMEQYEQIALMCEMFMTPNAKFSMHGFKNVSEMLAEIKRILEMWVPF